MATGSGTRIIANGYALSAGVWKENARPRFANGAEPGWIRKERKEHEIDRCPGWAVSA